MQSNDKNNQHHYGFVDDIWHLLIGVVITLVYSVNLLPLALIPYFHLSLGGKILFVALTYIILGGSFAAIYFAYRALGQHHFQKLTWPQLKIGLQTWLCVWGINIILGILNLLFYKTNTSENQQSLNEIALKSNKWVLIFFVLDLLLSPFAEEFIFRGFIMDVFFQPNQFWFPIFVSSVLFALGHATGGNMVAFLTYFTMGAGLGYIYKKTGNLKASIAMHILQNALPSLGMLILLFK